MSKQSDLRIVVDLDGTLLRTEGEDYANAKPIEDRIRKLQAVAQDNYVIINTARGSLSGEDHWETTVSQIQEFGIPYNEIRVGEKIAADIYVDDRSMRPEEFFGETVVDDD